MTTANRSGFTLAPVVETWEATVYEVTGSRTAYLVVPRAAATGFHDALSGGQIDATITDYLNTPDTGRTLDQHSLMLTLGLFDRLGDPQRLAAPERDPATGRPGQARSREDKDRQQAPGTRTTPAPATTRSLRRPLLAGAAIALIALTGTAIAIGIARNGGGDSGPTSDNANVAANVTAEASSTGPDGSPDANVAGEVTILSCVKGSGGLGEATVEITNAGDATASYTLGMTYISSQGPSANDNRDGYEVAAGETVMEVLTSRSEVAADVRCLFDEVLRDGNRLDDGVGNITGGK